ncbi:DUF3219 family protein [Bacillus sp. REN3]|uniref:DUF3219 family protein n=1 Tax=Bacillus sp. REN3 TaxID=2802440 RepID=UPI001AEE03EF|nr:DUF3219 family protein [Bacillus sp. REN3]
MVKEMILNGYSIQLTQYKERLEEGLHKVSIKFNVTSEEYYPITTLLYQDEMLVEIPETGLEFTGKITEYSTSVTNLYQEGQTGQFSVTFMEARDQ